MIEAPISLLKAATTTDKYDYYHLISGVDMPLKSQEEIHRFFDENAGYEFVDFDDFEGSKIANKRLRYYYYLQDKVGRKKFTFIKLSMVIGMKILIIEDEYNLADAISSMLKSKKYSVEIRTDGEEGLDNALTDIYDLILLDVMLPTMNGFDILKEIKNEKINAKVIMITAKSMIDDKLNGFNYGANDYITKPFHIEEVVARVNAQLRNTGTDFQKDFLLN